MALTPDAARVPSGSEQAAPYRHAFWWPFAVGFVTVAVAFFVLSYTHADPDLWGHVRFGQDLLRTRDLWRADVYSYLSGEQPWINHEWLAELAFALAYGVAGAQGLVALKTSVGLLIVGLIYRHLLRRDVRPGYAGAITLLSTLLLFPGLLTVRPHAFTYLGLTLLLLVLVEADGGHPRWLWALAPLFALWVNLHGGFLAGIGVLLLWSLARLVGFLLRLRAPAPERGRPNLAAMAAVAASILATLLNPYGVRLWSFLLRTATVPRPEITEWQPIHIASFAGVLYLALLVISWLGWASARRRRSPALLAVFAVLSVLPLLALRHAMLFAVAVPIVAGEHIGDLVGRRPARAPGRKAPRFAPWLACLLCLASVAVVPFWWPKVNRIGIFPKAIAYPVRLVALLRESGAVGNLAIDFDWGEYALWHLGPRIKVSVDGRRETVYVERVYEQNLHLMYGVGDWDAVLDEYPSDLALVSKARSAYNLMVLKPGWALMYEDPLCALFAREGSPLAAQIRGTVPPDVPYDGEGLSFP